MTNVIGRNDPCPCQSGKKYKYCCLEKQRKLPQLPWKPFPERFVLTGLLKGSDDFASFYATQRPKIRIPVYWAHDPTLPQGIDYRRTSLPARGIAVIRLRRIPPSLEDASMIAHEVQHLVLDAEGFPTAGVRDLEYEDLSSALSSMIADPIVNSRLQNSGFDVRPDLQDEIEESQRQLATYPEAPTEYLSRLKWVFNYVAKVLEWSSVYGDATPGECPFATWFAARYPAVAREAEDLLALVRELGYTTPSEQRRLLDVVIRRYNLQNIVFL
jgi:hypothetical protein